MNFTKLLSQNLDLDLKNQTFIFLFPYVWNPFKNILMTFETFLMMSITTERYLATRSPLEYRMGRVILYIQLISILLEANKKETCSYSSDQCVQSMGSTLAIDEINSIHADDANRTIPSNIRTSTNGATWL